MVARSTFTIDSEEEVVRDVRSGRVHNVSRRVAGQCAKGCYRCGAAREDMPVSSRGKEKGLGKGILQLGHWVGKPPPTARNVPPTTRKPQAVPPRCSLWSGGWEPSNS